MRIIPILAAAGAIAVSATPVIAQKHAAVHWKYTGEEGPANWGKLDAAWGACAAGKEQSPIDLGSAIVPHASAIDEKFFGSTLMFFHNGHTVQGTLDRGSTLSVDGAQYQAVQFHFHHPSEHTVKGKAYPAELHLVHTSSTGTLAVLGIFIVSSVADNPALEPLIARLPLTAGDSAKFTTPVDIGALLGAQTKSENYFRYHGSLTTPPCTEGVQWIVRERPIFASRRQWQRLVQAIGESSRPVQPVNARH